jgi:hypothetical protein
VIDFRVLLSSKAVARSASTRASRVALSPFQFGVVETSNAAFDGIVKAFETQVCFGGAFAQFGDMGVPPLSALLPPIKQAFFQMIRNKRVEFFHRYGHACASGWPLPCFGRASVIAVTPAFTCMAHRLILREMGIFESYYSGD